MRVLLRLLPPLNFITNLLYGKHFVILMEDQSVVQRRHELRKAVIELRARGLNAPAKWAAEQLTGLPNEDDSQPTPSTSRSADEDEDDTYLLAKSYFDLKV